MRCLLTFFTILVVMSCTKAPLEGLWIESKERGLLRFDKDSVIVSDFNRTWAYDTLGFQLTGDSITWTGLPPEWDWRVKDRSFKYTLKGDSLRISDSEQDLVYIKSEARSYQEYFLAKDGLKINLPAAVSVRHSWGNDYAWEKINIRIGFKDEVVKVFVGDNETSIDDLDTAIEYVKNSRAELYNDMTPAFTCQLFIDEDVTCDFTFRVFESLRANDISLITFVTETDKYNTNTNRFLGLGYGLPFYY